jgi:hypothetical protein
MKERNRHVQKKSVIQVVSRELMTADQQSLFTKAIDALLAELIHELDRRNKGEEHGNIEAQMAG